MPENQTTQYHITISAPRQFILAVQFFFSTVFNFLSLKKSQQFWGMVYDSVNKQPLDPVIVKLLYADGREVESGITDLKGRYGFLARPGKFKIFAKKTNYVFPSKYVAGDKDGIFENLYHGEFFELFGDSEVVAPNIPMDPEHLDWNQQAKASLQKDFPYARLFFKRLGAIVFVFGLGFALIAAWKFFPHLPWYLDALFGLYGLIIILAIFIKEPRLWGEIIIGQGLTEPPDLYLLLQNEKLPGITFGTASIHENGKFLLRASPGSYLLVIYQADKTGQKTEIGSVPVKIGRLGVFNSSLLIRKKAR